MKRLLTLCILLLGILTSCNKNVTPPIPTIYEYALTVVDKADFPIDGIEVEVFMPHKPDFVVMKKTTDIFGKTHFLNLKEGQYLFVAKKTGETETTLAKAELTVTSDNGKNNSILKSSSYEVPVSDLKVIVKSDKGVAIEGRKIELVTKEGAILYKSGKTDDRGELLIEKLPLISFFVKIYDEFDEFVAITEEVTIRPETKNEVESIIVKMQHNSDIVVTGMLVDPAGTDCPSNGSTSGGGFAHQPGYEYIQLMALKDIDFSVTPYCIVVCNNVSKAEDNNYPSTGKGWIGSKVRPSKTTYQINLTERSVKKGEFFYVGRSGRMIASYYNEWGSPTIEADRWWTWEFRYNEGADGNGLAKGGSGLFNNLSSGSNTPDGVAIFKGTSIDENTIPQDVVFYGRNAKIRSGDNYRICDNDVYKTVNSKGEAQPNYGDGTNIWMADQGFHDDGCFIMMGGMVSSTEWLKPRTGKIIQLKVKDGPTSVSIADIEDVEGVTKFFE